MILAVDLGSTSFKAAVLDRKLRLRGLARCSIEHRFGPGGQVELAVPDVSAALAETIREALALAEVQPGRLKAIGITSQAQTFTVTDARGRPRMPFISWQDARAEEACGQLMKSLAAADFARQASFGTLLPALQICQLKHVQDTKPGWLAADHRVVPLPTYFVQRWTGMAVLDDNLAAMSGLYSMVTRAWWPEALRACGLAACQLPRLLPVGTVAGHTQAGAAKFGLPPGIPVVLAGNDQTAGAYAAGLRESGDLLLTLGTAQVSYTYSSRPPAPHPALIRGPFPHGGFYRMAADPWGGNLVNWAKTVLAGCETDEAFFQQAALASPGCQGLAFEPGRDSSRLAWRNIALHHAPPDFARSVLEFLTRRLAVMIRQLGRRPAGSKILVAGGGSASPFWVRLLAEELGTELKVTPAQPFLGAARMALAALKLTRTQTSFP